MMVSVGEMGPLISLARVRPVQSSKAEKVAGTPRRHARSSRIGSQADDEIVSTADKKSWYRDVDQRASSPFRFTAAGKNVVYNVREKGVDNLWLQPLDDSPYRQVTHFTSEKISQFAFSPDGSPLPFSAATRNPTQCCARYLPLTILSASLGTPASAY